MALARQIKELPSGAGKLEVFGAFRDALDREERHQMRVACVASAPGELVPLVRTRNEAGDEVRRLRAAQLGRIQDLNGLAGNTVAKGLLLWWARVRRCRCTTGS